MYSQFLLKSLVNREPLKEKDHGSYVYDLEIQDQVYVTRYHIEIVTEKNDPGNETNRWAQAGY